MSSLNIQQIIISIRYDTRSYFNVHSKADISRLNLPHGTKLKMRDKEKLKSKKKTDMLRSIGKQSGESAESVLKKRKGKLR